MTVGPDGGDAPRRIDFRGRRAQDVEPSELEVLAAHVRAGGVLVHPTETVYGFGSRAAGEGLERVRTLKGREGDRPVLLLVPEAGAVEGLRWTPEARELAAIFWPGALTLLLDDPEELFPPGVRSGKGAVGVRRTAHPLTARLVEVLGEPLTSTSANAPGEPPTRTGEEAGGAARRLGAGGEAWVMDVGTLPPSAPSTIVDCSGARPRVVRAGAVPVERLRCLLPEIHERPYD